MENNEIKMYSVFSGNIDKIGHYRDPEKGGVLRVIFNRGAEYDYFPVSRELFTEMFGQQSKGSWFHSKIKNNPKISYQKVGEEPTYAIVISGKKYTTKFKKGQKVKSPDGEIILDSVDENLTYILDDIHWTGKRQEGPYSEKELSLIK